MPDTTTPPPLSHEDTRGHRARSRTAPTAPVVRAWAVAADGRPTGAGVGLDQVDAVLRQPGTFVWIDAIGADEPLLGAIQTACQMPLVMADHAHGHARRPRLSLRDQTLIFTFFVPEYHPPTAGLTFHGVTFHASGRTVVTTHARALAAIDDVATRLDQPAPTELVLTPAALLFLLLESILEVYYPVLDHIGDAIDRMQARVFERGDRATLQQLTHLRRALLQVRRIIGPQREIISRLLWHERPPLPGDLPAYLHDLYDHAVRLIETIDIYRDLLSTVVDTYLSVTSNNLNEIMKRLTGWSIILMTGALIAGIYGMNFRAMPELDWSFGYPLALGLMAGSGALLFWWFRRHDWL
jgi:magnesium transporter